MFTAFVLGYGHHDNMLRQCLESVMPGRDSGLLESVRIGLNAPEPSVLQVVKEYVQNEEILPEDVYWSETNAAKYPVMRQMFHNPRRPITTDYLMWFDDDSYIASDSYLWWSAVAKACETYDLVGQRWVASLTGARRRWLATFPWFDAAKVHSPFSFMQGAWWCMRTEKMREANWPLPELYHNGGDTLLGVMAMCQNWKTRVWSDDVMVNSGFSGLQSGARRRGITDRPIGNDWVADKPITAAPIPVFRDIGDFCNG